MRYFFTRLLLVAAPLLAWQIFELFVLPPNYFTFRPWEDLLVQNHGLFRGPFYPNQDIEMWAAGDLNPRGHRARHVRFRTDDYGYRNQHPYDPSAPYDFLIVGDSHFCGAGLHDRNTLAVVLEREYEKKTYNYASGWPQCKSFFTDRRFQANPPRYIVLDFRPEDIVYGRYGDFPNGIPTNDSLQAMLCEPLSLWNRVLFLVTSDRFRIINDRAAKQLGYNFLRARMSLALRKQLPGLTVERAERNLHEFIDAMVRLQGDLRKRGVKLILLLVPVPYPEGVGDYVAAQLAPKVPMVHWQSNSPYRGELMVEPWFEENDSHMTKSSVLRSANRIFELSLGL